ncbi:respiratory supercomplex factor 1- mitochondrial [Apiospora kogelbergensis]|uniref:respiratory supercomplex factor 1- mitochondrial n=1 Tax=Apiospora kogelbergensis TaxID=1337665 RepID=UPI0031306639
MDGSQYPNVIGTSGSSYPSPAAISPHQLQNGQLHQQNGHLAQHTLPPLQPHTNPAMHSVYNSHPHTPRTPGTPNPPTPSNNMRVWNYLFHDASGLSGSIPPAGYCSGTCVAPPVLRPMPAGGVMPQSGISSPYAQSPLMPQQSILQDSEQPTHVVGSQGRRGILPSAPGRPAAPTGAGASKNTVIPQKDADGKFPCPHCTKTYLHAKHLKRHLLRHTGDRPYMCVLCRDTFSRSDILKRHFQKCSIRRGNPTGASHLSHPQAHVKKHAAAQQKAQEGEMNQMNGLNSMQGDNVVHPFGMVQMQDNMSNMPNDQNQLSRSSSISRMDDQQNRDRRNMTNNGSVYGNDVQGTMASNINPQLASYNMPQGQNGMPMFGGSNNPQGPIDWALFQPGAQDTYVNSFPPPNLGQNQIATKTDPHNGETERAAPNDLNDRSLFFSNWGTPPTVNDPYQHLSNQIQTFFYPPGTVVTSQTAGVNAYFSPTNIKDFLEKYTHFHVHFSFLHIPTFRILDAYTGLIAGMCCVGACYSDRVTPAQVRDMMNFVKVALERDSGLFSGGVQSNPTQNEQGNDKLQIEKLQALTLLIALLVWNGTPIQRESARHLFPQVADIARRYDLLRVSSSSYLYSVLHQPHMTLHSIRPEDFDWNVWTEQERRIRLMHLIYLSDVSHGLYFNSPPQFDYSEMHIPLPADDAAWEGQTATECAEALHLYGSDAVKIRNPDGSQRSKQPELDLAVKALFHESYQIHPGSTNLYGKFILIHALLSQIRRAQVDGSLAALNGVSTPLSQNDWVMKPGSAPPSATGSANNSGRATPVSGLNQGISPGAYKTLSTALEKFKSNWDMDMAIQFPPSVQSPRRYGFCRDGIHFFWLAKWMAKSGKHSDLQMAPDQRMGQVMHLLKSVKSWVMSDGASRREELGSVGDIDLDYGVHDLTLNMADLFRPLPQVVGSPNIQSVKTEI